MQMDKNASLTYLCFDFLYSSFQNPYLRYVMSELCISIVLMRHDAVESKLGSFT